MPVPSRRVPGSVEPLTRQEGHARSFTEQPAVHPALGHGAPIGTVYNRFWNVIARRW